MPWFHADVHAGNLLVLDDGRVGFIDFGIVDVEKFGRDLGKLMVKMTQVQPEVTLSENADGMINGSIGFEDNDISQLLLDMVAVTEDNGLRLPREFGLLVKQSLYFDRYLKILAPGLDV